MPALDWTADQMPDLTGRTFLVTGAAGGLGAALTRHLAARHARVIATVRDAARGARLREAVLAGTPKAEVEVRPLNLLDLDAIARFADELDRPVDVLINNAGISGGPRELSPQGYESQMATNHLGPFALTLRLLDTLAAGADPRVVTVSSFVYDLFRVTLDLDDLDGERRYSPPVAYTRSKLAATLFGRELDRRLRTTGSPVRSLVAHPGMARTPMNADPRGMERLVVWAMALRYARPVDQAVLPLLYAATAPGAPTDAFIGPTGPRNRTRVELAAHRGPAADLRLAADLWRITEERTGVRSSN
ncbi:SDR family NAD(P)-dependent oxidoreductase [Sphaerisporangium fuscum]|uniref:SDR family NAD(P)-dependent oxidoreductase n=1 Tax=Sphaerisporangium fuscum TaxID=2835868 RepID=UPI001BDD57A5|nr:SDR family NAD(P)-dependent oxidoreductase [Sphaerisporangium fuscum]